MLSETMGSRPVRPDTGDDDPVRVVLADDHGVMEPGAGMDTASRIRSARAQLLEAADALGDAERSLLCGEAAGHDLAVARGLTHSAMSSLNRLSTESASAPTGHGVQGAPGATRPRPRAVRGAAEEVPKVGTWFG